jgi:hypothetical protein
MAEREFVVTVAIDGNLPVDAKAEARGQLQPELVEEGTRKGLGISDVRDLWSIRVGAEDGEKAKRVAARAVTYAFTGVDPHAEAVGLDFHG